MRKKIKNIPLYQILILSLLFMLSTASNDDKNEIAIIVNETESSEIINNRYNDNISQIIVNGKESDISEYKNHLKHGENEITIIFKDKLNSCEYMFYGLSNILKINLSNLYFGEVRNMEYMFWSCESLQSLDLRNVITSSVKNMQYLF